MTPVSTQAAHPWRATVRTTFAALVGLAAMWALIVETIGIDPGIPWVASSIAATGAITRVLALPGVIVWLERFVPWLAPGDSTTGDLEEDPFTYDAGEISDPEGDPYLLHGPIVGTRRADQE